MKESKVQIQQRKIANSRLRSERKALQKAKNKMWDRLLDDNTSPIRRTDPNYSIYGYSSTPGPLSISAARKLRQPDAESIRGKTFDTVIFNELVSNASTN